MFSTQKTIREQKKQQQILCLFHFDCLAHLPQKNILLSVWCIFVFVVVKNQACLFKSTELKMKSSFGNKPLIYITHQQKWFFHPFLFHLFQTKKYFKKTFKISSFKLNK